MSEVDFFNPFVDIPAHENRFTWAFLVTLQYDRYLQAWFREFVESNLSEPLKECKSFWENARIITQSKWIRSETNRLISILVTDESIEKELQIDWSDRDPVYDGVIEYPDGLTMIIENKPAHGNLWEKQLYPAKRSYSGDHDQVRVAQISNMLELV